MGRNAHVLSFTVVACDSPDRAQRERRSTMNYDETTIATTYDTARGHTRGVMRQWLDLVAEHMPVAPQLIVDVGCGTGRFSEPQPIGLLPR